MADGIRTLDDVFGQAERLGLVVESFDLDGEWHRVPLAGKKKSNQSGAYCLSEFRLRDDRVTIVGMLHNWVSGVEEALTLEGVGGVSAEELADAKRRMREAAEKSRQAKEQLQRETAARAEVIWNKLPEEGRSAYLDRKHVKAWGVRFSRGSVVVPARDAAGTLWTLQFIDGEGNKRFLSGGAKRGRYHMILAPEGHLSILGVAEGYATAATIRELLEIDVAVAFDAGNLLPVAKALRGEFTDRRIVVFADHDRFNGYPQAFIRASAASAAVYRQIERLAAARPDVQVEVVADDDARLKDPDRSHNAGVAAAILAAAAVGGDVVVPRFEDAL